MTFLHPLPFLASAFDSIVQFFTTGGLFMIPLALCSLVAVTITILRLFALQRESVLPKIVEEEIEKLPPGGSPEALNRLVRNDPAALSCLTRVALDHLRVPRSDNSEAVQTRARREIMRLESGLPALETIVGISPLLGLLGAISGLVRVLSHFGGSGGAAGATDTLGIAQGIAEVLYTTIFGLAIAIPALVAFTYFARKVEGMAVEMESLMAELLSKCYYQKPARPGLTPPPPAPEAPYSSGETTDDPQPTRASYAPQARRVAAPSMPQTGGEPV